MSERFKSINADGDPGDQNPALAENYRIRTPEELYPGDIVHPLVYSALAVDEASQTLYLNSAIGFGPDADKPSDYSNRFGVMRVHQAIGELQSADEPIHDGYLVDLRYVRPEHINAIDINDMDSSYSITDDEEREFGVPLPVLGYVYLDANDDVAYNGRDEPRIIETAMYFRDEVDRVRDAYADQPDEDAVSTDEQPSSDKAREPKFIAPGDKATENGTLPEPPSHTRES